MASLMQKIELAKQEEFDLSKSEIKKIYTSAKKVNPGKMPELTGWYHCGIDDFGFTKVVCEICDGFTGERLHDVVIYCCVFDRRSSWVQE